MHIFFSGIGGTAIGPLAQIAKQAGYSVSGSDKQESEYTKYLRGLGLNNFYIGQTKKSIAKLHAQNPIDWYVYSSAVSLEQQNNSPELTFCKEQGIKTSKRAELINFIIKQKGLKMIAVAGTHGKSTTTAMIIWLFKQLNLPVSWSVGAKISFGNMGHYENKSQYFVYEADEFERNFLAFKPDISVITGVSWDHHEIFPSREDYREAFREFISQSRRTIIWREDLDYLGLSSDNLEVVSDSSDPKINQIKLYGLYNRLDGWLAVQALGQIINTQVDLRVSLISKFPGLQRRMEEIAPNLYSDYAHTPEKIQGAMSVVLEMAAVQKKDVIVVYEPLTNRRQHYIINDYKDCFNGTKKIYWLPSYLAREDSAQRIIPPGELISHLPNPSVAEASKRNKNLKSTILKHLKEDDLVVCMSGGGGGSLDEWIRVNFGSKAVNQV